MSLCFSANLDLISAEFNLVSSATNRSSVDRRIVGFQSVVDGNHVLLSGESCPLLA